jgi:hypothetical protein
MGVNTKMKKVTLMTAVLVLAVALFAGAVSADLTVTSPTLGDDSTDYGETVSTTFTITNTGNETVNGISVSSTASSIFNVTFTNAPTSLAANASATVTVTGFVDSSVDAVDSSYSEAADNIGNVVVSGTDTSGTVSSTVALNMQVENQLTINKVRISINGENEKSFDEDDELDDIKPGDRLTISVEVENGFGDDNDEEYEDFDFDDSDTIVGYDFDSSDFDDDTDDDDIKVNADSEKTITFSEVDVEYDANDDYTLEVWVSGTAENDDHTTGRHGQMIEIDIELDKEDHEIVFKSVSLSPKTLFDGRRDFDVRTSFVNIGDDDEDNVAIGVEIPSLGISEIRDGIELDEGDDGSRTISIALPEDAEAGTYNVEISTYWNGDILSQQKIETLTIEGEEDTTTVTVPTTTTPTAPPVVTTTTTSGTRTVSASSSDDSFFDSGLGIAVLIVGIVAALAIIGLLIGMMVKKN